MNDLAKRLRIKAGMIEMGELIAWGSDIALMREAADALEVVAPDVQVEPVAYAVFADNGNIRIWSADPTQAEALRVAYGYQVQPLYTTPQPAERQPISHDWDDQDKCRRCGDRDWYASATCSPKQQSAPEVALVESFDAGQRAAQAEAAVLVEALARCQRQASYFFGDSEVLANQLAKVREIVNETLAAYHKGGEQ